MSTYNKHPDAMSRLSRFIHFDELESEGYGIYRRLFETENKE